MATRSKRFLSGMTAGYVFIATNVVFTLVSIPLALHYLDKETFGLWVLALQINGYLNLIDLGMSGAISRFVADHKDDVNGGEYGNCILTGGLVFFLQGLIIAALGIGFSFVAPAAFGIEPHHAGEFRTLLVILCSTTGGSVALRGVSAPLWAFQRNDLINGCAAVCLMLNLLLLWLAFASGFGVLGLALASIPGVFLALAFYTFACWRNGYYPSRGNWGRPAMDMFLRIFGYGRDVFLLNVGNQLLNASQVMIISRWVGLEAAATYSVATKFFALSLLLVQNPVAASSPGLTELYVRGDIKNFVERYWDLISLSLALAAVVAVGLAATNRAMVSVWTDGKVVWDARGDLILACLVVLRILNGCFVSLFGCIKNLRPLRYLKLMEGVVFVPLAIFGATRFGVLGVMAASLVCHLAISTSYSARAAKPVIGSWLRIRKEVIGALALVLFGTGFGLFMQYQRIDPWIVIAWATPLGVAAPAIVWFFMLPPRIRDRVRSQFEGVFRSKRTMSS